MAVPYAGPGHEARPTAPRRPIYCSFYLPVSPNCSPRQQVIAQKNGRVNAVETPGGSIACESIICAAGLWGPVVGSMVGVVIPAVVWLVVTPNYAMRPDNDARVASGDGDGDRRNAADTTTSTVGALR